VSNFRLHFCREWFKVETGFLSKERSLLHTRGNRYTMSLASHSILPRPTKTPTSAAVAAARSSSVRRTSPSCSRRRRTWANPRSSSACSRRRRQSRRRLRGAEPLPPALPASAVRLSPAERTPFRNQLVEGSLLIRDPFRPCSWLTLTYWSKGDGMGCGRSATRMDCGPEASPWDIRECKVRRQPGPAGLRHT
jgi:hypothetical protein